MMAKKNKFAPGYMGSAVPHYESEGSDSLGRIDSTEDASALTRKWIDLNYASKDGFAVPIQTIPVSQLSSFERKNLALRLKGELHQIRLLKNSVEAHNKTTISAFAMSSTNNVLSGSGVKHKGFQFGGPKKSFELVSMPARKGHGSNRGSTGKFETGLNPYTGLFKQCESLLKALLSHKFTWVFDKPVDVEGLNLPDYYDIIKNPMDLGTIKGNLETGKYLTPMEFVADVRLTFTNAKTYNPRGSDVHIMADTMSRLFESKWKNIEKKIPANVAVSLPEKSSNIERTDRAEPVAHLKKRKLSPTLQEVKPGPAKRKMTDEEKHKIGCEVEELMEDLPDNILDFLKAHCSSGGDCAENEIELDIDNLTDDVLFALRKLLDDHLQHKKKNLKSEVCEIELPNVSGFSNSSLQVDKGNDDIDEDVDIGGNEAPVTSYPPLVIDKDNGVRAEERTEAGPGSDRGSEYSKGSLAKQHEVCQTMDSNENAEYDEMVNGHSSLSGLDHTEHDSRTLLYTTDAGDRIDGETSQVEGQVSPNKLYRAALLKNRFADTILKAREKTLTQDEKADPEKIRQEREALEMQKKKEKARLQAEAKAAEDARRRVEAEAKKKRELEREAAREALLKMEKTVEIENSRFLEDFDILRVVPGEQLPSCVDETSPEHSQDGFGSFKFGSSNALEQLGLYMKKEDDEEEEAEPPSINNSRVVDDRDDDDDVVEEGEI